MSDPTARQARILHDRHLAGELRQQPYCAMDHIIEIDRADQEPFDRAALGGRKGLDSRKPIYEQPIALVRRDPPGAGMRLAKVALFLQYGHVVADGGRGNLQVVPFHQRLAAYGLLGRDVVLDDHAQHLELAIVERHAITVLVPQPRHLALVRGECQSTSAGA